MRTKRNALAALLLMLPFAAAAQDAMQGHEHHHPPAPATAPAQPQAMDDMPGMQMDPQDEHAGHTMPMPVALPPNDHVPPPPPQHQPAPMPPEHMVDMMQMDDLAKRGMWLFDRLERTRSVGGDYATAWEAEGWWGSDTNRVWLRTEGERSAEGTQDARAEVLWGHAFSTFWDWQLGVRHDFGHGPDRQWVAAGVQGLAPYWFETQATFYAGTRGRTALRLQSSYDLRFTQRLILAPELEVNFYGKDDPQRGIRAGLSEAEAGLRLRYEFSRRFAPYIGVNHTRRFGQPNGLLTGLPRRETTWLAGVRLWF
ncbi:copper resistance protein B [Dyella sp. LX-66]|uniref:copper resistance protein B n=1 Tax=unclassified Dyella TaxID=2634549 RepID=UPI001BE0535F|nr:MULTISPECIES: copper resistance protein B [unclassified Dyella]MBT2119181.1 copper resistance protein B [Dyella sp. LX-1]MBT2141552.1 copper resistance protein B [Dyella sp. LX-66]